MRTEPMDLTPIARDAGVDQLQLDLGPRPPVALWRIVIDAGAGASWTWQSYATSSTDATLRALAEIEELYTWQNAPPRPKFRVTEVLQVGV